MSKPKTCIICGELADSAEHIFPAALGGRITNRRIYCDVHNRLLGKLVTRLQRQLAMMNAALEVRPDREDGPKPFMFESDGAKYKLLGADIELDMPPPFDPKLVGEDGKYPMMATDRETLQRWIAQNQSAEWTFKIEGSGAVQQHIQSERPKIHLDFGGVDFLQSVGYLALTSFAHFFPAQARQAGLDAFKDMLKLDLVANPELWPERVWWDGREPSSVVGDNPYEFGHVIAVGFCQTTYRAYAYISFFSCLSFGIDLGTVTPVSLNENQTPNQQEKTDSYIRTFIDPTKDKAANSTTVVTEPDLSPLLLDKGVSLHAMIHSGSAAKALEQLQEKIYFVHADKAVVQILEEIHRAAEALPLQSIREFLKILEPRRQTVFNLIHRNVTHYSRLFETLPPMPEMLGRFVEGDDSQHDGLAPVASQILQNIMLKVAVDMHREYINGRLDAFKIKDLLYGSSGDQLIRMLLIRPMLRVAGVNEPL